MRQALFKCETPRLKLKSSRSFLAIKRWQQRTKSKKVIKHLRGSKLRWAHICAHSRIPVNLVSALVGTQMRKLPRYGEAHYQYWYQFWHRLPHTRKFTSSHLPYFVNFVLATLLCSIYHKYCTLSLSSLSLAYCTISISPSRVVTIQLCRIPTPLQATSSHL